MHSGKAQKYANKMFYFRENWKPVAGHGRWPIHFLLLFLRVAHYSPHRGHTWF